MNLNIYPCLHYKRLIEFLNDVFNPKLSERTICNTLKKAHSALEKVENFFKKQLAKAEIAYAVMKQELRLMVSIAGDILFQMINLQYWFLIKTEEKSDS